jgi:hypothetical protein
MPKVIPPRSRVRLVKRDRCTPTWRKDVGRRFRVGSYSRNDGLDCIWLVDEDGEYEQTTDRESLLKYFENAVIVQVKFCAKAENGPCPVSRLNGSVECEPR